jgi:hypothetical protein
MSSEYKTFRTKTGYCHITDEQIVLSRDGVRGEMAKITNGNSISQSLIIYGVISVGMLVASVSAFLKKDYFPAVISLIIPVFLIYSILKSLNNSATPIIDRKSIQEVRFHKAITGITRAYFEVYFKDDKGKVKKRMILLPGSIASDPNEIENAVSIMQEEGLLKK